MQPLPSQPTPVMAFSSVVERVTALNESESLYASPESLSLLLHHGEPTERVYLLFHGYTNSPAQLSALAHDLYAGGANVLVPLAEGHGRRDRSPVDLSNFTARRIAEWAKSSAELATPLGRSLVVAGFSFGGVCATWVALAVETVDEVVLIAPAFAPYGYPAKGASALARLTRLLPERYLWWDPVRRDRASMPSHAYPRLSRRGIGAVFDLGDQVCRRTPSRNRPLGRAVLVLNECDVAINAVAARRAFDCALAPRAQSAEIEVIDASHHYPHDFIDPRGRNHADEAAARAMLMGIVTRRQVVEEL